MFGPLGGSVPERDERVCMLGHFLVADVTGAFPVQVPIRRIVTDGNAAFLRVPLTERIGAAGLAAYDLGRRFVVEQAVAFCAQQLVVRKITAAGDDDRKSI